VIVCVGSLESAYALLTTMLMLLLMLLLAPL
jgi:hypothetical protein